MISIVRLTIKQGEFTNKTQLCDLAKGLFENQYLPAVADQSLLDIYIKQTNPIYTCVPRTASKASFLWGDAQEFEVVIETFPGGDLLRVTEGVVNRLNTRLLQIGYKLEFEILIQSSQDGNSYITGERMSISRHILNEIQSSLIFLVIGICIMIIAFIFLNSYFEESIAACISLTLLIAWQTYKAWSEARTRLINWKL